MNIYAILFLFLGINNHYIYRLHQLHWLHSISYTKDDLNEQG